MSLEKVFPPILEFFSAKTPTCLQISDLTLYISLYHLIQVMAAELLAFSAKFMGCNPSGMTATLLGQPLDTIKTLMQSLGWTFSVFGDDLWEGVIELLMTPFNQISWK